MFELKTGGRGGEAAAARLAHMVLKMLNISRKIQQQKNFFTKVMQRRQLEKRDTLSDFWASRLHDMQVL